MMFWTQFVKLVHGLSQSFSLDCTGLNTSTGVIAEGNNNLFEQNKIKSQIKAT